MAVVNSEPVIGDTCLRDGMQSVHGDIQAQTKEDVGGEKAESVSE